MIRTYDAIVARNDDPEKLGRVRCRCRDLVPGKDELPFWIEPVIGAISVGSTIGGPPGESEGEPAAGWFWVPEVDSHVILEIRLSDESDQGRWESFVDNPQIRFRPAGYSRRFPPASDFTTGDYPRVRGLRTPSGHTLIFNDQTGVITIRHADGQQYATMSADGTTTIEAPRINVGAGGSVALNYLVRGDELLTYLNDWYTTIFNQHIHGTGVGPSGLPVPTSPAAAHDDFLSDKHYVE